MRENEELSMTFSGVLKHNGRNAVCIRFERGKDYAEGYLPEGIIERVDGFSDEEQEQLLSYMKEHQEEILKEARKLNNIKRWFA